jgi:hypothetical protein
MADPILEVGAVQYRSTVSLAVRKLSQKEHDELLALAMSRAPDPSVFDDGVAPFFFQTRASNNQLDSYFTWMADSSLTNYAADASDPGVQFQVSHNGQKEVGFGRSLRGKVIGTQRDRSCLIDFYTIPGLRCGNMTSDEFIMGSRAGVFADVSIGFTPGAMICSICENDFLQKYSVPWDDPNRCDHWPGDKYDVKRGNKTVSEVCTLRVEDSHLNEVSTVYDGATPGAGIVAVDMARMAASAGLLDERQRSHLETLYRFRIDAPDRVWAPSGGTHTVSKATPETKEVTPPNGSEVTTDDESKTASKETRTKTVIAPLAEKKAPDPESLEPMDKLRLKYAGTRVEQLSDDPYEAIEALADELLTSDERIVSLEKQAEDGRQFVKSLLDDLDRAVVRAFGADGAEERKKRYRTMADALDANGIRDLTQDLENRAGDRFKGGRTTKDGVDSDTTEEPDTLADRPPVRRGVTRHDLAGV